jgi:hypothetical protein
VQRDAHAPLAVEREGRSLHVDNLRSRPAGESFTPGRILLISGRYHEAGPAVDAAEVLDDPAFENHYLRCNPTKAFVMAWPPKQGRKGSLVDPDHPPQLHDPMKGRNGPAQMAAGVVELEADPAGELVGIEMLAAPAATGQRNEGRALPTARGRNRHVGDSNPPRVVDSITGG